MAAQSQRWVTLILSCIVVTVLGLGIVAVEPALDDSSAFAPEQPGLQSGVSGDQRSNIRQPFALVHESPPPLPIDQLAGPSRGTRFARYDDIVVEVKQDGTLRVLGEQMEMDALKSLLSDQLREQLQTVVTIRPDGNCLFRHVGPVIAVCEDVGVPHQTMPRKVPASIGLPLGEPA